MDFETLGRTGQGAEALAEQMSCDPDGRSEYPLSDAVKAELEKIDGLDDKAKLDYFNDKAADVRRMSGDIRDAASSDGTIEIDGMGTYSFEFSGRREPGKDGKDEEISLRISRALPNQRARSFRTRAIFQRIIDREAPIIKNASRSLNLRKRQRTPQSGHFVVLIDAHETVAVMHKTLGLGKEKSDKK